MESGLVLGEIRREADLRRSMDYLTEVACPKAAKQLDGALF